MKPDWLILAESHKGTKEVKGRAHNALIVSWLDKLGAWWRDDETAWCGTFVAICMKDCGLPYPKHWYRAMAWADYGSLLRPERLAPGAILVFERKGGGHVGFYVGEDDKHYHVFGGNQADSVNVMRISKERCIATRWPKDQPVLGKPLLMAGGVISDNEA